MDELEIIAEMDDNSPRAEFVKRAAEGDVAESTNDQVSRLRRLVDRAQARVIRRIVAVDKVDQKLLAESRATRDALEAMFLYAATSDWIEF